MRFILSGFTLRGAARARRLGRTLMLGVLLVTGAPLIQAAPAAADAAAPGAMALAPVNINTADVEQLQNLRGIGPKTAALIVEWREQEGPFQSVDQLLAIKGIGEKTLARLRDQLNLCPPARLSARIRIPSLLSLSARPVIPPGMTGFFCFSVGAASAAMRQA